VEIYQAKPESRNNIVSTIIPNSKISLEDLLDEAPILDQPRNITLDDIFNQVKLSGEGKYNTDWNLFAKERIDLSNTSKNDGTPLNELDRRIQLSVNNLRQALILQNNAEFAKQQINERIKLAKSRISSTTILLSDANIKLIEKQGWRIYELQCSLLKLPKNFSQVGNNLIIVSEIQARIKVLQEDITILMNSSAGQIFGLNFGNLSLSKITTLIWDNYRNQVNTTSQDLVENILDVAKNNYRESAVNNICSGFVSAYINAKDSTEQDFFEECLDYLYTKKFENPKVKDLFTKNLIYAQIYINRIEELDFNKQKQFLRYTERFVSTYTKRGNFNFNFPEDEEEN